MRRYRALFVQAAVFAAPLFLMMMVLVHVPPVQAALMIDLLPRALAGADGRGSLPLMSILAWALATPVQVRVVVVRCALFWRSPVESGW